MPPLLYLDTGVLSIFRHHELPLNGWKVVYSDANMLDLKNDHRSKPEIEFLQSIDALHVSSSDDVNVRFAVENVAEVFERVNTTGVSAMGALITYMHGGGAEASMADNLQTFFELASAEEPLVQAILKKTLETRPDDLSRTTNRDIESTLDKSSRQISKLISYEEKNVLLQIRSALDINEREAFDSAIPKEAPGFEGIQPVVHALGLMDLGRSKNIRKRNDEVARKTGRHDHIDAMHIAYGLHCHGFVTNDKATATKFRLLNEYWNLGSKCLIVEQ